MTNKYPNLLMYKFQLNLTTQKVVLKVRILEFYHRQIYNFTIYYLIIIKVFRNHFNSMLKLKYFK